MANGTAARALGTVAAAAALLFATPAFAQATCEGVTGNGRCNSANVLNIQMPTTNVDGTPFNDYASTEVVFALTPGVCPATGPIVGATVKNMGPLAIPVIPLLTSVAKTALGPIGLPNGKLWMTARVVDLANNRSLCVSPELVFTNDNVNPAAPPGQSVN